MKGDLKSSVGGGVFFAELRMGGWGRKGDRSEAGKYPMQSITSCLSAPWCTALSPFTTWVVWKWYQGGMKGQGCLHASPPENSGNDNKELLRGLAGTCCCNAEHFISLWDFSPFS